MKCPNHEGHELTEVRVKCETCGTHDAIVDHLMCGVDQSRYDKDGKPRREKAEPKHK